MELKLSKWDKDRSTQIHRAKRETEKFVSAESPTAKSRIQKWISAGLPIPTKPESETCDLCGDQFHLKHRPHLDHCHDANTFRGWLCKRCNTGLGLLGDNEEGLLRALDYLKRTKV